MRRPLILIIIALIALGATSGCISSKRSDPYHPAFNPSQMRGTEQSASDTKKDEAKNAKYAPKSNALLLAGIEAESVGDLTEAEKNYLLCVEFNESYKIPKNSATAYHRLAVVTAKLKDYERSEKYFREAMKTKPQDTELMCDFAQLLNEQKRYYEAELVLNNARLINPEDPKTLYFLGNVLGSQGHYQLGLRYLRKSIGEIEALKEIAVIYRKNGEHAIADATERKIARLTGEDDDMRNIAATDSKPEQPNRARQYQINMPELPNPDGFLAENDSNSIAQAALVSAESNEETPSREISDAFNTEKPDSPIIAPASFALAMDQRTKRISLTPYAWEQSEPDTFLLNARTQSGNNSAKKKGSFLNILKPTFALRSDTNESHSHESRTDANSQVKPVPSRMAPRNTGSTNEGTSPPPAMSSALTRVSAAPQSNAGQIPAQDNFRPMQGGNSIPVATPVVPASPARVYIPEPEPVTVSIPQFQHLPQYGSQPMEKAELAQVSAVSETRPVLNRSGVDPKLSISEGSEHDFSLRWPRESAEIKIPSKYSIGQEASAVRSPDSQIAVIAVTERNPAPNGISEPKSKPAGLKLNFPEFEYISLNEPKVEVPLIETESVSAFQAEMETVVVETAMAEETSWEVEPMKQDIPEIVTEIAPGIPEEVKSGMFAAFTGFESHVTPGPQIESTPVVTLPGSDEQYANYVEPDPEFKFTDRTIETPDERKHLEDLRASEQYKDEIRRADARLLGLRQEEIRLREQRIAGLRGEIENNPTATDNSVSIEVSNAHEVTEELDQVSKEAESVENIPQEPPSNGNSGLFTKRQAVESETSELSFVISSEPESKDVPGSKEEPEIIAEPLPEPPVLEKRPIEVTDIGIGLRNTLRNGKSNEPVQTQAVARPVDSFEDYYYAGLSNEKGGYFGENEFRTNTKMKIAAGNPTSAIANATSLPDFIQGAHSAKPGGDTQVRHPESAPGSINTKSIR